MNRPAQSPFEPNPDQELDAPPAPVQMPIDSRSNIEAEVMSPEPPDPATIPEGSPIPQALIPQEITTFTDFPDEDQFEPSPIPVVISESSVPDCPIINTIDIIPDPPLASIPPAPFRSEFEQGN